jgi:hypothetical protein
MTHSAWKHGSNGRTVRRRKKGRSAQPFIQIFNYMLATPAWLSLPAMARAAYIQIAARYNGSNNGKISLSSRELADELGCARATAARALTNLDDAGFIRPTSIGQFKLRNRKASEYRLTAFRCDETGEAATKDFQQWAPADRSDGLTHETVRYHQRATPPPKSASRSHPRDRQPENIDSHGLMGETLLDLPEGACTEESRQEPDHADRCDGALSHAQGWFDEVESFDSPLVLP